MPVGGLAEVIGLLFCQLLRTVSRALEKTDNIRYMNVVLSWP